jgi:tryptophan synthase alpha chain
MSYISKYIQNVNDNNRKVLSIFLTGGFPSKDKFVELAKNILDAGADMFEIGIPFSDPLADGPVIQASSKIALDNGVTLKDVLNYSGTVCDSTAKPIILMGYANPIRKYGLKNFLKDSSNAGIKGLIIPDVPLEEYDSFFEYGTDNLDVILLTTPTSTEERIKMIDNKSSGFVYCVSITGTTGTKDNFSDEVIQNISRTRAIIKKNKMLIGFGVSKPEDIKIFSPHCDGVIVGSAVIKSLMNDETINNTLKLISQLSMACNT